MIKVSTIKPKKRNVGFVKGLILFKDVVLTYLVNWRYLIFFSIPNPPTYLTIRIVNVLMTELYKCFYVNK